VRHKEPSKPATAAPGSPSAPAASKTTALSNALSFIPLPEPLKGFEMEVVMVVVLIAYGVNYFLGASQNALIGESWGKSVKDVFEKQFAKVGADTLLKRDSANTYKFTASGRRNCFGAEVTLNLSRRQDLFAVLYGYYGGVAPDTVTIDVAIDEAMDPIAILVAPKTTIKGLRNTDTFKDIKFLTDKERELPELGGNLSAFSDSFEALDVVFSPDIRKLLTANSGDLRYIHITNMNPRHSKINQTIRVEIRLPPKPQLDRVIPLYEAAFDLIDSVATTRLSAATKSKADEKRQEAVKNSEEVKERRAEEQEKLQDAKRKAEKARLAAMSPADRAKEEERLRKRQMRKQTGKMKIILK